MNIAEQTQKFLEAMRDLFGIEIEWLTGESVMSDFGLDTADLRELGLVLGTNVMIDEYAYAVIERL